MSKYFTWLSAAVLALVLSTGANAFEGFYQIKGGGPNKLVRYEGVAAIKQSGETYSIAWRIGAILYVGTGILTGDVLSVVFQPINARAGPGVASFRIQDGHVVGGNWTSLGSPTVATEQWTPEQEPQASDQR